MLTAGASAPQYVAQSTLSVGSASTATTATNVAGGAAGSLIYQTAAATTSTLALGTSGYILTAGASAPTYIQTLPAANGGTGASSYTAGDILYASGTTALSKLAIGTAGQALVVNSGATAPAWTDQFLSITYIFSNPAASDQGDLTIPFACTITEWTLLADANATSTTVVDIWKDTYANYPPTIADVITASAKPTIATSSNKGQSSTLTGWTATIAAGDTLRFNVNSVGGINRLTLSLKVKRT